MNVERDCSQNKQSSSHSLVIFIVTYIKMIYEYMIPSTA